MDRLKVRLRTFSEKRKSNLHSSMDRLKEREWLLDGHPKGNLHSSMDRLKAAQKQFRDRVSELFTFQYG